LSARAGGSGHDQRSSVTPVLHVAPAPPTDVADTCRLDTEAVLWSEVVQVEDIVIARPCTSASTSRSHATSSRRARRDLDASRVERISRTELSSKPFSADAKLRMFSDIVAAATKKQLGSGANWRTERAVRTRTGVAWAFNGLVYFTVALLTLTHGSKFTARTTNEMLTVWLLAMLQIYLIIEPVQILVIACLPMLCDQSRPRGRCCTAVKRCWHDVFNI